MISAVAPHNSEELSIRDIAEELFKKPRFRSYITKERVTCLSILGEACRVTLQIPAALFVLNRSFRRPEERLLGKVDPDLKPSWSSDPHVSVKQRTRRLARRRNTSKLRRGPALFDRLFGCRTKIRPSSNSRASTKIVWRNTKSRSAVINAFDGCSNISTTTMPSSDRIRQRGRRRFARGRLHRATC